MNWNPETYLKAWHFASRMHRGQTYGGLEPGQDIDYINHIGSVSMEIVHAVGQDRGTDASLAIQCALLHDTLEDTKTTYEQLNNLFGEAVAQGVLALTKNKHLPSKKEQMLDSLARIRQQPREVWMVKMADRITNLYHPPYYWNQTKILAYQEEAKLIHTHLADANPILARRLLDKIETYQQFISPPY